jgi:sugar/nucleoside kinase (ribokinase family)
MTTKPKLVVLDTMNWMDCALPELLEVIKSRRNYHQRRRSETNQAEVFSCKAAAKIQAMGPKYVVIKKGEHGALLFHDQMYFAPALPLEEVFDPTGAGDTLQEDLQVLLRKANVSFENMKMRLFTVLI